MNTSLASAPRAKHRTFFAVRPDPATAARIVELTEDLRRRHGIAAPAMPAGRLHVSLNFVAKGAQAPPAEDVARARKVVEGLDVRPFRVCLNRVVSWRNTGEARPLVLCGDEGVIGLERLHGALHRRLSAAGLAAPAEPERWMHMSLLWGRHDLILQPVAPIEWTVRELVLLDSLFGEGRHRLLGRWALG